MNKIKLLICILFVIISGIDDVGAEYPIPQIDIAKKNTELNTPNKALMFGNLKVNYYIGLGKGTYTEETFYPIKIKFSEKTSGSIEIFTEEVSYTDEDKKLLLYKTIDFKDTENINTYVYKNKLEGRGKRKPMHFYIKVNGVLKKLELKGEEHYFGGKLYIQKVGGKFREEGVMSEVPDAFFLKQFGEVHLVKEKISEKEWDFLRNYVYNGGDLVLVSEKEEIIKEQLKNLRQNNQKKGENYTESRCAYYNECDDGIKDEVYYTHGYGVIFINKRRRHRGEEIRKYFTKNDIEKILLDEKIKSKFVPFDIILYFVIVYFGVVMIVNFVFGKKRKENKFFLLYSLPITSIVGLIVIFSISMYHKGNIDIENVIQINYHKDGKILKEVHSVTFTPSGGDYSIEINKEDYVKNKSEDQRYYRTFSEIELQFEDEKIIKKYGGYDVYGLIKLHYSKLENEKEAQRVNLKGRNFYNKNDMFTSLGIERSLGGLKGEISKIILEEKRTEYMKKYTYGGVNNKNYVIDVFYK